MDIYIPRNVLIGLGLVLLVGIGIGVGVLVSGGDSNEAASDDQSASDSSPATYTPPPDTVEKEPVDTGPPSCDQVINQSKTGLCEGKKAGSEFKVAYLDQTLSMETLDAHVEGITTADTVGPRYLQEKANGIFLTVALAITNKQNNPIDLSFKQNIATLEVNGNTYTENFDAENQSDQKSFMSQSEPIQPGVTQVGHLIYDVPPEIADNVLSPKTDAGILIPEFGGARRSNPIGGIVLRAQGS